MNDRERDLLDDPRIQTAIQELKGLILRRFPSAAFTVGWDEDPDGIYIDAIVDVENLFDVIDLYSDRLVDLQVFENLPIYVVPVRTAERNAEVLRKQATAFPRAVFP